MPAPYPRTVHIATREEGIFDIAVDGKPFGTARAASGGSFWVHTPSRQQPRTYKPVPGRDLRDAVIRIWRNDWRKGATS